MKSLLHILFLLLFIIPGCKKENHILPLLQSAERLLPAYADSASVLLDSISAPDEADDETFARWCMLRGKVTDETATGLLPIYQWQRAQEWFTEHGTVEEQARIALYLGRAYVEDGEYDKAMKVYADALQLAKAHQAYNVAGYICAYMADLYGFRNIISECLKKKEEACKFFKKAENYKSYAYALKNLAGEWALADSFSLAMPLLQTADSLSQLICNKDLSADIANAFALVYEMQEKYNEAETAYLKAIAIGSKENYKDSIGLLKIYIKNNKLAKAYELVETITEHNDISYSFNEAYCQLYKAEGKYKEALYYKEICLDILNSLTTAQNETKVLEIEKKYNNAKIREENDLLKIAQQRNIIIIAITLSLFLLSTAGYIIYRQKAKAKLYQQQAEIDKIRIEYLHLSVELEEKKQALQTALSEESQKADRLQQEIESISFRYRQLQQQQLESSATGKRLATLVKKNKLEDKQTISTNKARQSITMEIDKIYPGFYSLLKESFHPALTEQEFYYCYLHIFGYDSNDEAKLLAITPDTVLTKRARINQKRSEQSRKEVSLRDFLIKNLLK